MQKTNLEKYVGALRALETLSQCGSIAPQDLRGIKIPKQFLRGALKILGYRKKMGLYCHGYPPLYPACILFEKLEMEGIDRISTADLRKQCFDSKTEIQYQASQRGWKYARFRVLGTMHQHRRGYKQYGVNSNQVKPNAIHPMVSYRSLGDEKAERPVRRKMEAKT